MHRNRELLLGIMNPVLRGAAVSGDWWEVSGAICLDHVEDASIGEVYDGDSVSSGSPWTIAVRFAKGDDSNAYVFDSLTGRIIFGYDGAGKNGFFDGEWHDAGLFDNDDHVYILVSDGSDIQAYRDNVAQGASKSSSVGIGGTTRWFARYYDNGGDCEGDKIAGAVYSSALTDSQRASLGTAMNAL